MAGITSDLYTINNFTINIPDYFYYPNKTLRSNYRLSLYYVPSKNNRQEDKNSLDLYYPRQLFLPEII